MTDDPYYEDPDYPEYHELLHGPIPSPGKLDVERLAKAMDQAGLDGETTPFPLRVLADLIAAEYERLAKP